MFGWRTWRQSLTSCWAASTVSLSDIFSHFRARVPSVLFSWTLYTAPKEPSPSFCIKEYSVWIQQGCILRLYPGLDVFSIKYELIHFPIKCDEYIRQVLYRGIWQTVSERLPCNLIIECHSRHFSPWPSLWLNFALSQSSFNTPDHDSIGRRQSPAKLGQNRLAVQTEN